MPWGDRTGPMGYGPMTGRAAGFCAGYQMPGYANSAFGGRGFRNGSFSGMPMQGYGRNDIPYAGAGFFGPYGGGFGFGRGRGFGWRRFGRGGGAGRGRFAFGGW